MNKRGAAVGLVLLVGCGGDPFTAAEGDAGDAAGEVLVDATSPSHDASEVLVDGKAPRDAGGGAHDAGEVLVDASTPRDAPELVDAPACAPVTAHGSFTCYANTHTICADQALFFCDSATFDEDEAGQANGYDCLKIPPECACAETYSCACLLAHPSWLPAVDAGYASVSATCVESDAGALTVFPVYSL